MTEELDWIEQAAKVGVELRESIREGHMLLRDLKITRREMEESRREIQKLMDVGIPAAVQLGFQRTYGKLMSDYQDEIATIADKAINTLIKHTSQAQDELITGLKDSVDEAVETISAHMKEKND